MPITWNNFLLKYPAFTNKSGSNQKLKGTLQVKGHNFHMELFLPHFPSISGCEFVIFKGIHDILIDKNRIDYKNWDIEDFLKNISKILEEKCENDFKSNKIPPSKSYIENFLKELKNFFRESSTTNAFKIKVNSTYEIFRLTDFDGHPKHFIELNVTSDFRIKLNDHSLPEIINDPIENCMFRESNSLYNYLEQFQNFLLSLDEFYSNLETIDELCEVVEPVLINTKHNWRIFKISGKVFIQLTLDPSNVANITVKFIGPTYEVEKYRHLYNKNLKDWDTSLDVHKNLLRIFNILCFPSKNRNEGEKTISGEDVYCHICYTYELENHIPIISCENPKCDLIYHIQCIKKWFQANGKTFLTVTTGNCPFCKEKISASFAQLLEY